MDLFRALWRILDVKHASELVSRPEAKSVREETTPRREVAPASTASSEDLDKAMIHELIKGLGIRVSVMTQRDVKPSRPRTGGIAPKPDPSDDAAFLRWAVLADATAFPSAFAERLHAVPIPDLITYYPYYGALTPAQKRAYVYIRQEFLHGTPVVGVPLSYLFLFAYEIGSRCQSLAEFAARLTKLRDAYLAEEKLSRYLAAWIVDARLADHTYVFDDITRELPPHECSRRADLALLAGVSPASEDLVDLVDRGVRRVRLVRAVEALRTSCGPDPIVAIAASSKPVEKRAGLFAGYGGQIPSLLDRMGTVPTFLDHGSPTMRAIRDLVGAAAAVIGERIDVSADPHVQFVTVTGVRAGVPIDRSSAPEPSFLKSSAIPHFDTLDGLKASSVSFWDEDMRLLMSLVLWQAEVKPYVEGQIVLSGEQRRRFDALATELGTSRGIGPYRRSFFRLSVGTRAPWALDVSATAAGGLRMDHSSARFVKGLQHTLRGSAARAEILGLLVSTIAQDRSISASAVTTALSTATGADRPQGLVL